MDVWQTCLWGVSIYVYTAIIYSLQVFSNENPGPGFCNVEALIGDSC